MVAQAQSTYAKIEQKVRRLTASSSQASLASADIEQAVNVAYSQDFPSTIKLDQMRGVYTFFTEPYRDRYPIDMNFNNSIRGPMYVDGIQGGYFKDRQQFYALWPRFPTLFNPPGVSSGAISLITQANPAQVTSDNHGLATGDIVYISGVLGMTEVNGGTYHITVVDADNFTLNGVDSTGFTPYISGGTFFNLILSFNVQGPFLSKEVILGGVDQNGNPISINDNGSGELYYLQPNPKVFDPPQNTNPAIPGMYNTNNANPGLNNPTTIGIVNYVTGDFTLDFSLVPGGQIYPDPAVPLTLRVSQYQTGRPYNLMWWNNEFTIRPVPKHIHKIEVETYMTPVQFLDQGDIPIMNNCWQYLAYIAAAELLRERGDFEGVDGLQEGLKRQEAQVLENQANEEIFTPNPTIFNSVTPAVGGLNGIGYFS